MPSVTYTTYQNYPKPYAGMDPWYSEYWSAMDMIDTDIHINTINIGSLQSLYTTLNSNLNAHSARHEYGGADLLSLSSLRGSSIFVDSISGDTTGSQLSIAGIQFISGNIRNVASPVQNSDAANKAYVDNISSGLDWQESVLDKDLNSPPGSPSSGDRYIIASGATGAWAGQDDSITEWNGASWDFIAPNQGFVAEVEDENKWYRYNGSAWVDFASIIQHNSLTAIQGGVASEYYHFTNAQHTLLSDFVLNGSLDWIYDLGSGTRTVTVDDGDIDFEIEAVPASDHKVRIGRSYFGQDIYLETYGHMGPAGDITLKGMDITLDPDAVLHVGTNRGTTRFHDQYLTAEIPLTQSGTTGLSGFTATSVIAALNELKVGDGDSIHDNVSGEINAVALKGTPVATDIVLIEDSADSFSKKKVAISSLSTTDPDAIHDNVSGEINAVTNKAAPVGADIILIEDSEASFSKKRVSLSNLDINDSDAIHDNVSGEIHAVALKGTPVGADEILIEDSADSFSKKRVALSTLTGAPAGADTQVQYNDGGVLAGSSKFTFDDDLSGSCQLKLIDDFDEDIAFYTKSTTDGASWKLEAANSDYYILFGFTNGFDPYIRVHHGSGANSFSKYKYNELEAGQNSQYTFQFLNSTGSWEWSWYSNVYYSMDETEMQSTKDIKITDSAKGLVLYDGTDFWRVTVDTGGVLSTTKI